jgi:hypothetical protein
MPFPNDLSDVVIFKIHPAIGIARVAKNDDYYVFGQDPRKYKSNGRMKRQAVQFKVFAYGDNHVGLGELTPQVMGNLGVTAVWSAKVANRKIARLAGTPLEGTDLVIAAQASSDDANSGQLVGSLPTFLEGSAITPWADHARWSFHSAKGRRLQKDARGGDSWMAGDFQDCC